MKHKLRQILRKLAAGLSWRKVFPIILGAHHPDTGSFLLSSRLQISWRKIHQNFDLINSKRFSVFQIMGNVSSGTSGFI